MAHHGSSGTPDWMKDQMAAMFPENRPGPTGRFPQGKLTPSDEGEVRLAVGSKGGKVVIDFGAPLTWFGMDPDQADGLADLLKKHAADARSGR